MENSKQGWTPLGMVVRIIVYSGILISMFLPFFLSSNRNSPINAHDVENELAILLNSVNFNKPNSFQKLLQKTSATRYSFRVLSPMTPTQNLSVRTNTLKDIKKVVFIAQPLPNYNDRTSYIGIAFEDNTGDTKIGICKMTFSLQSLPTELPSLNQDGTIQCPSGFKLI